MKRFSVLVAALMVLQAGVASAVTTIKLATFNAKSDPTTDVSRLAEQIENLTDEHGIDAWVIQEVDGWESVREFRDAADRGGAGSWGYTVSRFAEGPGGVPDHLAIIFRTDMFKRVENSELHALQITNAGNWNYRMRPMFSLRLEHKATDQEFWLSTVNLKCCGNGQVRRHLHAKEITEWVAAQSVPGIVLGDFNIPIPPDDPDELPASEAFEELTDNLTWLRPENPTDRQRDGSMLDAVFYSGSLQGWNPEATILNADENLDALVDEGFSDHRPIVSSWRIP